MQKRSFRRSLRAPLTEENKNSKAEAAYNALLRHLSRRDHSEKELQEKLSRWYTTAATQTALAKAHELSLIKDEAFLQKQFADGLHRRAKGIFAINRVLKKKGLAPAEADHEQELAKCQALLLKKFGSPSKLSPQERAKAYRHLTYRGFDSETINKAINLFQTGSTHENSR